MPAAKTKKPAAKVKTAPLAPVASEPGTTAGTFTKTYVKRLERMMENRFDPAYLAFLQDNNVGVPTRRYFKLGRNKKVVERFLGLVPDYEDNTAFGPFDVGVVWSQIEDRLNEFLVPFAVVFAGDFLCFDHEERERPRVVLWNHDLSEEDEPSTTPVADDFEAFLALLVAR